MSWFSGFIIAVGDWHAIKSTQNEVFDDYIINYQQYQTNRCNEWQGFPVNFLESRLL